MMISFVQDVLDNLSTMVATDIDLYCVVCNYALDCLGRKNCNVQRFACIMSLMLVFESFVFPVVARLGEGKEQKKMTRWSVAQSLWQFLGLAPARTKKGIFFEFYCAIFKNLMQFQQEKLLKRTERNFQTSFNLNFQVRKVRKPLHQVLLFCWSVLSVLSRLFLIQRFGCFSSCSFHGGDWIV